MSLACLERTALLAGLLLGLSASVGCEDQHAFVGGDGYFAFAMTEATPAFIQSEEASLFIVENRITLPIEPPTDDEINSLTNDVPMGLPFPRRPWVERGDYGIEVDWTLSSLEDQPLVAWVTVNGFNEFHEYMPGAHIEDDDLVIDFAMWERSFELGPNERISGTIREEEMDEMATDLATVVNGAPNSHMIVYFESQSATDPRSQMYIPPIIPGLTGFRMGIRSEGCGMGGCNLVLEATVRVRDVHGKIVDRHHNAWDVPMPAPFVPVVVEEM